MSKKMKKKKMRYAKLGDFKTKSTILYEGTVNNHKVVIVNVYGRHPSAYIAVADNRVKYVEELLHCHGGVSFTGNSCFGDKRGKVVYDFYPVLLSSGIIYFSILKHSLL
jgi:hypothetical protein